MQRSAFFCKRTKCACVLLHSLQKNVAFFAFFYVLWKRLLRSLHSLHSFLFFRKERKRTQHSFGSHKSPKTWKKNVAFFKRTEKNGTFRMEKKAVPNPGYHTLASPYKICQNMTPRGLIPRQGTVSYPRSHGTKFFIKSPRGHITPVSQSPQGMLLHWVNLPGVWDPGESRAIS